MPKRNGHANGYTAMRYRSHGMRIVDIELVHDGAMYIVRYHEADVILDVEHNFTVRSAAKPISVEKEWGKSVQIPHNAMSKVIKALPK